MSDQLPDLNNTKSDEDPTMLGQPFWSSNPVEDGATTTLTVPVEYDTEAVVSGEYFVGNNDPGQGNGSPMEVKDVQLTATVVANLPTGSHTISIRAKADSGTWSSIEPSVLTIMSTPPALDSSATTA